MTFADEINRLMARLGLTQSQLAQELGVSRQAVQFWSSGRSEPKGSNLAKYKEYLTAHEGADGNHETVYRRPERGEDVEENWTRVPLLDVYGSCGGGGPSSRSDKIVEAIDFYTPFLRNLPGVIATEGAFELIHSSGDSMEPTIMRHAVCLVDRRQNVITSDSVYCIQAENQIFIKRVLRNFDGSITLLSDNQKYPPQNVKKELLENARVIGRVVFVFNGNFL